MDEPLKGPEPDGIERWGRIVGRTLGWGFAVLLAVNLVTRWLF